MHSYLLRSAIDWSKSEANKCLWAILYSKPDQTPDFCAFSLIRQTPTQFQKQIASNTYVLMHIAACNALCEQVAPNYQLHPCIIQLPCNCYITAGRNALLVPAQPSCSDKIEPHSVLHAVI